MDISKLFKIQKKLDEHIEQKHPRFDGEDRLSKKILALQVELAELAQNWRVFKYWSEDQEPRTYKFEELDEHQVKEWNPLLEEYVDCLHFILSIGNEKKINDLDITQEDIESNIHENIVKQFSWLFRTSTDIFAHDYKIWNHVRIFMLEFLALGEMLGFTWEQIEQAYLKKNAENHVRQDSNY